MTDETGSQGEPPDDEPTEEPPAPSTAPAYDPPMRGAWLVLALAALCLLGATVALEAMTRAATVKRLGREPASWADPQLREFVWVSRTSADRWPGAPPDVPPRNWRELVDEYRRVAEMARRGDVAAEAYRTCAWLAHDAGWAEGRDWYAWTALGAAPDDSPHLGGLYHGCVVDYVTEMPFAVAAQYAEATLWRAATPEARLSVAVAALRSFRARGYPQGVPPWAACEATLPDPGVAASPYVRWQVAEAYRQMGQWDRACAELTRLIPKAEPDLREYAQKRLAQLRRRPR